MTGDILLIILAHILKNKINWKRNKNVMKKQRCLVISAVLWSMLHLVDVQDDFHNTRCSWCITVRWWVPPMDQDMHTIPEPLSSSPVFCCVLVAGSLFFCAMFCRSLFILLYSFFLAVVLPVLLLFTDSDYPFDIFTLQNFNVWQLNDNNICINDDEIYGAVILMRRKLRLVILISKLHLEKAKDVQRDSNIKECWCCLTVTRQVPLVKQ